MGNITGFLQFTRELPPKRSPDKRVNDYKEFVGRYNDEKLNQQSGRCMDCGIPFCHHGCPLGNIIPEFNDAVYNGKWEEAVIAEARRLVKEKVKMEDYQAYDLFAIKEMNARDVGITLGIKAVSVRVRVFRVRRAVEREIVRILRVLEQPKQGA